jgi:hypothetical protein
VPESPVIYSPTEPVARILTIRRQKVILDSDLARIYGVETKTLNQAVKRNADRFPAEFMFRLTPQEVMDLRSQFVTSNTQVIERQHDDWNWSQFVTSSRKHRGIPRVSAAVREGKSVYRARTRRVKSGKHGELNHTRGVQR